MPPSDAMLVYVQSLLGKLKSEEVGVRQQALSELQHIGETGNISKDAGLEIIRAATQDYPRPIEPEHWHLEIAFNLIGIVAVRPRAEYARATIEVFPQLSDSAQTAALTLLARLATPEAAAFFANRLQESQSRDSQPAAEFIVLQETPFAPALLVPELFKLMASEGAFFNATLTVLSYLKKQVIGSDAIAAHVPNLIARYRKAYAAVVSLQQPSGTAWMWSDEYHAPRSEAGLLLDLFGYVAGDDSKAELVTALGLRDPRLVCFAAASSLRRGQTVATEILEFVGSYPETRNQLFNELQALDKLELFSKKYLSQDAFAESEMVTWLTYPTELASVPDEIEMVGKVSSEHQGHTFDTFLFRFRVMQPHWGAKEGWMVGWSGPFVRGQTPTTTSEGLTFSQFEHWSSKPVEDHIAELRSTLESVGHRVLP